MTTQIKSLDVSRMAVSAGNRILAAVFLIYLAPVMLAVAFLIKMDSRGPVLMRHSRRGANGEVLALLEFRTMVAVDNSVPHSNRRGLQQTELGAFLWETRLDMLPRLVNMLRGEVSFATLLR
jgi:lipopolysaccharide/colanic/teichoic acid biosynthesis glycosyltransferase